MTPTALAIPGPLRSAIAVHACAEFPAECCGYLVGPGDGDAVDTLVPCRNAQEDGIHPTEPARGADTGFVIAGHELLAFAKSFEGTRPARVVYHSHTNGRAYFSAVDRELAVAGDRPTYDVQHLVIGVTADGIVEAAQFAWSADARAYVEVARWSDP
ncbi:MAG TPA: Mov34/MPN/PAD-1 family protein [Kofleriaceae bacterium]